MFVQLNATPLRSLSRSSVSVPKLTSGPGGVKQTIQAVGAVEGGGKVTRELYSPLASGMVNCHWCSFLPNASLRRSHHVALGGCYLDSR